MKKDNFPLISISMLNWNGLEDTKKALVNLRKSTYPNFEIIVVDNGSVDGSKEWLAKQTDIVYVDLPKNLGVTGGHNEALKYAKGEFIANFNNDAVVDVNWLMELYKPMSENPKIAVTGGKAYEWDEKNKLGDVNNSYFAYQVIDEYRGYAHTMRVGREEASVNSISTVGALMRKSAIDKVGYFDDDFFAYYDETDQFARFKRAGYEIHYTPKAYLWHKIGSSTKDIPTFYIYHMFRNRFIFGVKNFDKKYLRVFIKQYIRDSAPSLIHVFKGGKDPIHKAHSEAFWWNVRKFPKNFMKRKDIKKLGPAFNELLHKDAAEYVSIVIPNYNYAKYVGEAIESAAIQTQTPLEIIVIDDGSTDNSKEVIDKYVKKYDFVRAIYKKNEGIIDTKNLGLMEAKGEWIIFLDADDELGSDYLQNTLEHARKNNFDVVYTNMTYTGAKNSVHRSREFSKLALLKGNYAHNSSLYKKSYVHKAGAYKKEMSAGYEDWELNISLMEASAKFGYLDKDNFYYRQHPGGGRNDSAVHHAKALSQNVKNLHRGLYRRYAVLLWPPIQILAFFIKNPFAIFRFFSWVLKSLYYGFREFLRVFRGELRGHIHNYLKAKNDK